MSKRTARVQVAVALYSDGEWNCAGWHSGTADDAINCVALAQAGKGLHIYLLAADLILPSTVPKHIDVPADVTIVRRYDLDGRQPFCCPACLHDYKPECPGCQGSRVVWGPPK